MENLHWRRKNNLMETLKKIFRLEQIGPFFVLILSLFVLNVLYGAQSNWNIINNTLAGLTGAAFNYVAIILAIFWGIFGFSVMTISFGIIKRTYLHLAINLIIFPIIMVLLVGFLFVVANIDPRFKLDFFWYSFGLSHIYVYIVLTILIEILLIGLIFGINRLLKVKLDSTPFRPKAAAISTMISAFLGSFTLIYIFSHYPAVSAFWTELELMFMRYVESIGLYMLLLVIPLITLSLLMIYQYKQKKFSFRQFLLLSSVLLIIPIVVGIIWGDLFGQEYAAYAFGQQNFLGFTLVTILLIPYSILIYFTLKITNISITRIKVRLNRKQLSSFFIIAAAILSFSLIYHIPLGIRAPSMDLVFNTSIQDVNGVTVPFQGDMVIPSFEIQPNFTNGGSRLYLLLAADDWKFKKTPGNTDLSFYVRTASVLAELSKAGYHSVTFNDTTWTNITVPSCFNVPFGTPDGSEYQGVVWYRRHFDLPNLSVFSTEPAIILKFYGANYITDVWIDGSYVGYHEGGYNSFAFDVTNYINTSATTHLITIRVDSVEDYELYGNKIVPPPGDFFNYGGIWRDLYLEFCENAHIVRADVRPVQFFTQNYRNGSVNVEVDITIKNSGNKTADPQHNLSIAIHRLIFPNSSAIQDIQTWKYINATGHPTITGMTNLTLIAQGTSKYNATQIALTLNNISFWSTKSPALYLLEVNLTHEGITDRFFTQTGFRNLTIKGNQLLLNGHTLFLAGNSYHEEYPGVGRTLTNTRRFEDLTLIQTNLSSNFFRTHYPLHPYSYLLADRMGLACWEENPAYWLHEIHFIYGEIRNSLSAMFLEMIYRDYNRPSILFWGACNEPWSESMLEPYLAKLRNLQETLDPNRIVTFAQKSSDLSNYGFRKLQIVTPNTYWGTFEGEFGDFYDQTIDAINIIAQNNPNKPIMSLEFGLWRSAGEEKQVQCFLNTTSALLAHANVVGFTHWIAFDYYGQDYYNSMGAFNLDRSWAAPVASYMKTVYENATAENL